MTNHRYNLIKHLTIIRIILNFGIFLIWLGKKASNFIKILFFIFLIIPKQFLKIIVKLGYQFIKLISLCSTLIVFPIKQFQKIIKQKSFHSFKQINNEIIDKVDKIKTTIPEFKAETIKTFKPQSNRKTLLKSVLGFSILIIIIVAPIKLYQDYTFFQRLKIKLSETAEAAINNLSLAKSSISKKNFTAASSQFNQANANFSKAGKDLETINSSLLTLANFFPNDKIKLIGNSKYFTEAGELTSKLGLNLSLAMGAILNPEKKNNIVDDLNIFLKYGAKAQKNIKSLNKTISKINQKAIPEKYRSEFIDLKKKGLFLETSLAELLDITKRANIFLGSQYDKRYLLIFQNNTEVRATGGFMGSFALVDFSNGKIKKLEVPKGGTYDTEGGLRVLVAAPKPLWLVNPLWHFWDCNWWPDWPTSAKKIMWFYEKSDGPTVDGVISFTPDVIIDLLKILGPIKLDNYDTVITADNFLDEVQTIVEKKPKAGKNTNNHPKAIIGDLLNQIIEKLTSNLNQKKLIELISLAENNLNRKNILFYFQDKKLENKIIQLGWGGEIKSAYQDYLMVVNTNIAGAKSDRKIKQRIYYNPEILPDGTVLGKLRIEREHQAKRGANFVGFRNVDWLRIYVPLGSKLIKASGFKTPDESYFETPDEEWRQDKDLLNEETAKIDPKNGVHIYKEHGKTVFANWSMVDPGETTTLEFIYKLPFKITTKKSNNLWQEFEKQNLYVYTFLAQKQPGTSNSSLEFSLKHSGYNLRWQYPEKYPDYDFLVDRAWAMLFTNK